MPNSSSTGPHFPQRGVERPRTDTEGSSGKAVDTTPGTSHNLDVPHLRKPNRPTVLHRPDPQISTFKHTPLPRPQTQIRLLRLHAGPLPNDIACQLEVHDLDKAPPYQTISYTWGAAYPQCAIFVNGERLMVYPNCRYALSQARRHTDPSALLWMDRICINQDDLDEKGHQVQRISKIFRRAVSTLACVGAHENNSEFIFRTMQSIEINVRKSGSEIDRTCGLCKSLMHEYGFSELGSVAKTIGEGYWHSMHRWLQSFSSSTWKRLAAAMDSFAKRSYWSRVWIIPEIKLSETIQVFCGRNAQDARFFRVLNAFFVVIQFENELQHDDPNARALARLRSVPCGYDGFSHLYDLLGNVPSFTDVGEHIGFLIDYKCSDPKDKIYALIDVFEWDPHRGAPAVDYRKSPIELSIDIAPHFSSWGRPYPGNIQQLLGALEYCPSTAKEELLALRNSRRTDWSAGQQTKPWKTRSLGSCKCISPVRHKTGLWICHSSMSERCRNNFSVSVSVLHQHHDHGLAVSTSTVIDYRSGNYSPKLQRDLETNLLERPESRRILKAIDEHGAVDIIGLITKRAETGDVLTTFPVWRSRGLYLVLRKAFSDVYEIIGYAIIDPLVTLINNASDHGTCTPQTSTNLVFDFWFDAEDAVAHAASPGVWARRDFYRQPDTSTQFELLESSFTRERFSSFATRCAGQHASSMDDTQFCYCVKCVLGGDRCICNICGGNLDEEDTERSQIDSSEELGGDCAN